MMESAGALGSSISLHQLSIKASISRNFRMRTINQKTLHKTLGKNISRFVNQDTYEVKQVDPAQLLTSRRFDVIAKYLYVKNYVNRGLSDHWKDLYLEHIKVFNGYVESDGSGKVGPDGFIDSFNSLIESIRDNGLSGECIIPRGESGDILDGAHRLACALYFGLKVDVVDVEFSSVDFSFNQDYFQEGGMSDIFLDEMALEYAKLKSSRTYMVSVWPRVSGQEEPLREILANSGSIIYHKSVDMSLNGMINLMRHAYREEAWLGGYHNDFEGAQNKASFCFKEGNPLRVYLFESTSDLIRMKDEIRELYKVEKHAVHINDTAAETVELSELLFNNNSVHCLNVSQRNYFETFNRLFDVYKVWLSESQLDESKFCLIGGPLAAYGVRESKDIDFLTSLVSVPEAPDDSIELEDEKTNYISASLIDLVHNPECYFYYGGAKFSSLQVLHELRSKRGRDSDILEIDLVKSLMASAFVKQNWGLYFKKFFKLAYYKRLVKYGLLTARFYVRVALKRVSASLNKAG